MQSINISSSDICSNPYLESARNIVQEYGNAMAVSYNLSDLTKLTINVSTGDAILGEKYISLKGVNTFQQNVDFNINTETKTYLVVIYNSNQLVLKYDYEYNPYSDFFLKRLEVITEKGNIVSITPYDNYGLVTKSYISKNDLHFKEYDDTPPTISYDNPVINPYSENNCMLRPTSNFNLILNDSNIKIGTGAVVFDNYLYLISGEYTFSPTLKKMWVDQTKYLENGTYVFAFNKSTTKTDLSVKILTPIDYVNNQSRYIYIGFFNIGVNSNNIKTVVSSGVDYNTQCKRRFSSPTITLVVDPEKPNLDHFRALDPYCNFNSVSINALTRSLSGGRDCILLPQSNLDVQKRFASVNDTLTVKAGGCIKDDVLIDIPSDYTFKIDDSTMYEYLDSDMTSGYYYIVLKYDYAKVKPAPEAQIYIVPPKYRDQIKSSSSYIFLKCCYVNITTICPTGSWKGFWQVNKTYAVNDVIRYNSKVYKSLMVHKSYDSTSSNDPESNDGKTLWKVYQNKNAWLTSTNYVENDIVSVGSSSYICIKRHSSSYSFIEGNAPSGSTNDVNWLSSTYCGLWKTIYQGNTITTYNFGDLVLCSDNNMVYQCIFTHAVPYNTNINDKTTLSPNQNPTYWKLAISSSGSNDGVIIPWSDNKSYTVGQHVTHQGLYYTCKSNNTSVIQSYNGNKPGTPCSWVTFWQNVSTAQYDSPVVWKSGLKYDVMQTILFNNKTYYCLFIHDSKLNVPSTFPLSSSLISNKPGDDILTWVEVTTYVDRGDWTYGLEYHTNDIVKDANNLYIARINPQNDVNVPGVGTVMNEPCNPNSIGWSKITEWTFENIYHISDYVSFSSKYYKCLKENFSCLNSSDIWQISTDTTNTYVVTTLLDSDPQDTSVKRIYSKYQPSDYDDLYYRKQQTDSFFEGEYQGKKLVSWPNVINKPNSEIISIDVLGDNAKGKGLDNLQARGILRTDCRFSGGGQAAYGKLVSFNADGSFKYADKRYPNTCPASGLYTPNGILLEGYYRDDSKTWEPNKILYVDNDGNITSTQPTYKGSVIQSVGVTVSSHVIHIKPTLGNMDAVPVVYIPQGLIIGLNQTAIPAGWTEYTAAQGRLIKSSTIPARNTSGGYDLSLSPLEMEVTQSQWDSMTEQDKNFFIAWSGLHGPGKALTLTTTTDGAHSFPGATESFQYNYRNSGNYGIGGAHSHMIQYSGNILPSRQQMKLIKCTSVTSDIPVNGVVFSTSTLSLQKANMYGYMMSTTSSIGYAAQPVYLPVNAYAAGDHAHYTPGNAIAGVDWYGGGDTNGWIYNLMDTNHLDLTYGNHTHSFNLYITNIILPRVILSAWSNASQLCDLQSKVIGMWDQEVIPDGWALCDGNNGTMDFRNHFISFDSNLIPGSRYNSGADQKIEVRSDSFYADAVHNHLNWGTYWGYGHWQDFNPDHRWHAWPHSHYVPTQQINYNPYYYNLVFIQKI